LLPVSANGGVRRPDIRSRDHYLPDSQATEAELRSAKPVASGHSAGRNRSVMTRRGRRWILVVAVLLVAVFGGHSLRMWSYTREHTELDKGVMYAGWRPDADVTDIVVRHLPNDYNGAIETLLRLGFHELRRSTGANDRLLDIHDAVSVKAFRRKIPGPMGGGPSIRVNLMLTKNGDMKAAARMSAPKF